MKTKIKFKRPKHGDKIKDFFIKKINNEWCVLGIGENGDIFNPFEIGDERYQDAKSWLKSNLNLINRGSRFIYLKSNIKITSFEDDCLDEETFTTYIPQWYHVKEILSKRKDTANL